MDMSEPITDWGYCGLAITIDDHTYVFQNKDELVGLLDNNADEVFKTEELAN